MRAEQHYRERYAANRQTFGIGYSDDISAAEAILSEILDEHPMVLKEP